MIERNRLAGSSWVYHPLPPGTDKPNLYRDKCTIRISSRASGRERLINSDPNYSFIEEPVGAMVLASNAALPGAMQLELQRCILWEIDPQGTLVARPHAPLQPRSPAVSLSHSLSRCSGRRRSKPVFYGGPLNTGWRAKSVVKIINGPSARCALSPDRQLQLGAFVEPAITICNDISSPSPESWCLVNAVL